MNPQGLLVAAQAFQIEALCLQEAFSHVDQGEFERAVTALATCNKIASSACGHSGMACQHFAHLMCCIERPARFIYPSEAIHGASGYLQKGDVMLLASRGGKSAELLPIMDICKKKELTTIVVTENMTSPLAKQADILLKMYVTKETDPENYQGTTSHCMMNALFDALQAALIVEMNYQSKQFALIHPGGAVGDQLNKR